MNAKRLRKLADIINKCEYSERGGGENMFSMSKVKFSCGAPACIIGWAESTWEKETAVGALGLQPHEADELFTPENGYANWGASEGDPDFITVDHAVTVLRYFADTGAIDWSQGASKCGK